MCQYVTKLIECFSYTSAARKVDTKRANLLQKVAPKRATLKNRLKTSLKQVFSRF